jgi:hypothetical protein
MDLIYELQSIPTSKIKYMQKLIAKYGHIIQYAVDDYPNDGIEVLLKGVHVFGKNRKV